MNVRYQVFISSTFTDLHAERRHVIDALTKVGFIAVGMEQFPSTDEEQMEYIRPLIDESDYYVVIMKGKYGSVDNDGISYTEKEFNYAVSQKKPVLAFLYADTASILVSQTDQDPRKAEKLQIFTSLLKEKRIVTLWRDERELVSAVKDSLYDLTRRRPSFGWVRGSNAIDPKMFKEIEELRRQNADLLEENARLKADGHLLKGDNGASFRYWIVSKNNKNPDITEKTGPFDYDTTWDRILRKVVELLYLETAEYIIDDFLCSNLSKSLRLEVGQHISFEHNMARACRFQFEALGIIETFTRKSSGGAWAAVGPRISEVPMIICWRLSDNGKTYVSRMLARSKPVSPSGGSD